MTRRFRLTAAALAVVGMLSLAGCGNNDPLNSDAQAGTSEAIVVGSQDYYSNEIVAEIYAQSLESAGYTVDRQYRIGQREVYLPEIEAGKIDLFPEYTGNLLQYWKPDTTARLSDDVYAELVEATPDGLKVLDQAPATDQDSYVVTREFAEKWNLSSIEDLAKVTDPVILGGSSELETRPYGPKGLQETYAVPVSFTPIEGEGGPLTIKALLENSIQLADISTASPQIKANDLVTLDDPKGLFLASNLVPLASDKLDDQVIALVNKIDALMTPNELLEMNVRSTTEQKPASAIAADWIKEKNL
ncbi:MAG: ABC transporter substrate-binding protein [Propionibacterium sp.]|nr:ABC transporter substrate-binding protein [Propionibacterium sp.]